MLNDTAKTCFLMVLGFCLLVAVLLLTDSVSPQPIPVENSKTGAYKALAQVTYESFRNGDLRTAATLGKILDRTWEQVEVDGEQGLSKNNPALFKDIDQAKTAFTAPLIHCDQEHTDCSVINSAYKAYLDKLSAEDAYASGETVSSITRAHE